MLSAQRQIEDTPSIPRNECNVASRLHVFSPEEIAMSPSLQRRGRTDESQAREVKFLIGAQMAAEIEGRVAKVLTVDPHVDPAIGNGYDIATLYYDTPEWDVFHRRGRYGLIKFRARRYGTSPEVFLERKSRQKARVRKRRTMIHAEEFDRFDASVSQFQDDSAWFHRQLARHKFRPACLVGYRRDAYFSAGGDTPIRVTFDRDIRGGVVSHWSFGSPTASIALLADSVVCEFKFRGSMPAGLKSFLHEFQLSPHGVSKYRKCMQAAGFTSAETSRA